nr:hypothetical protein [Nonlabens ulvanivorans]
MNSIRESVFYPEVLKEINMHYGNFYFFDGFIVSEVFKNVVFGWEEAKPIVNAATSFYNTDGSKLVYISNRINKYSVKPVDWFHFANYSFKLMGYGVVNYTDPGLINSKLESLFVKSKFKSFTSLMDALQWAAALKNSVKS